MRLVDAAHNPHLLAFGWTLTVQLGGQAEQEIIIGDDSHMSITDSALKYEVNNDPEHGTSITSVSPKRRELDTVMKKARRDGPNQSNYWNKKLLEVEEKDPNRWRHSGFKELYGGGASSPVGSRSSHKRSSRSRSRSRGPARQSRTRARSPPAASRPRSRERSRERERERERRPHTPVTQPQRLANALVVLSSTTEDGEIEVRISVQSQPSQRTSRPVVGRRSPRILSLSASSRSLSSCSDESCSVCSPKGKAPKKPPSPVARPRYRTPRSSVTYNDSSSKEDEIELGQAVHSLQSLLALSAMVLLALQTYMKHQHTRWTQMSLVSFGGNWLMSRRSVVFRRNCVQMLVSQVGVGKMSARVSRALSNGREGSFPLVRSREGGWRGLCKLGEKTQGPNREAQQGVPLNWRTLRCWPSMEARPDAPKGNDKDNSCLHDIAFAELMALLEDINSDEDTAPVFKQVDIAQIYKEVALCISHSSLMSSDRMKPRSRSFSVPRNHPTNRSPPSPRPEPRRPRERSSPPRDPRRPPTSPPPAARTKSKSKRKEGREKIKVEGSTVKKRKSRSKSGRRKRRRPIPVPDGSEARRRSSPPVSGTEDSDTSSQTSGGGAPRLTLSERFGKMAQWSVDRRDFDSVTNMRITKETDSSDFKVVIEGDRYRSLSPMPVSDRRVGMGYYPETLHTGAPVGLEAWDDVRVRYKYYKDRGYLRDLSLDDYMKWEEWWYKYQDWLETERYYEHWAALRAEQQARGGRRRMRR
uniref:Uncharacterized protein n=1 Tax=Timema bartmani TaxID=61472 RepID=A0A7R9EX53_9NEOP|nr:unnamed protein product [Timema bartmani]